MISDDELYILSYYRAGELAGSLLFGRLAFHTTIDRIRTPLTRHCLEEAEHAWLWTKTIRQLGHEPLKVTETYQTEYAREFGMPRNMLEIFCLTQVLERRVLSHFQMHRQRPGTHAVICDALQKMIDDEQGHLGWIWKELEAWGRENGEQGEAEVRETMARLEEIDDRVYNRLVRSAPFEAYFSNREVRT